MASAGLRNTQRHLPWIFLLILYAGSLWFTRPESLEISWNDETLYYTVGQNIARNLDLNSRHYLAASIARKGYPTKDTHSPGYPMILALGFRVAGVGEALPYFLNYAFTGLTMFLVYLLGRKWAGSGGGSLAAVLFLFFPLTLPLTQSAMSEPAAALCVTAAVALVFLVQEGIGKGLALALLLTLACLIKPFLAILVPACAMGLGLGKRWAYQKTLAAFLPAAVLLAVAVVLPCTSNQEYYPFALSEIASRPGIGGKITAVGANARVNLAWFQVSRLKTGEGLATLLLLIWTLAAAPLLYWNRRTARDRAGGRNLSFGLFASLTLASTGLVLLAVLLLYEYQALRGIRALYAMVPLLAVVLSVALHRWMRDRPSAANRRLAAVSGLVALLMAFSAYGWHRFQADVRRSRAVQYGYMMSQYRRVAAVIQELRLNPRRVLSKDNFYLPIGNWPTEVVWTTPRTLAELAVVQERAPLDLLELKSNDPLLREAKALPGRTADLLPPPWRLAHSAGNFLYFVPDSGN